MSPQRLALRTLMLGRPRSVMAILLIAACLCALALFGGDLASAGEAGVAFAVIGTTIAATMSMNVLERRREVATLRLLGMRGGDVFLMVAAEALWMATFAALISLVTSGLIAWVVNRAALSFSTPMHVELDFRQMGLTVVAVMAVALLAALAPALKAARAEVAEALAL
jgi:ABC-type antimicrobial peptide transport system permease subunit